MRIYQYVFGVVALIMIGGICSSYAQLKDPENQADFLVLYHSQFEGELDDYIAWRELKGLRVIAINIDRIYEEFGDAPSDQESIREFIGFTVASWRKPAPQSALLVGATTLLPTFRMPNTLSPIADNEIDVPIDDWFAVRDGDPDAFPALAIGRFPARTVADLHAMIDKTMEYEDRIGSISYAYDFTFLTDVQEGEFFENLVGDFVNAVEIENWKVREINARPGSPNFGSTTDLLQSMQEGSAFVNYYGHGNSTQWSSSELFTNETLKELTPTGKPFVLSGIIAGQDYDLQDRTSIVEDLLTFADGGAVASIAPSGLIFAFDQNRFLESMYRRLFSQENPSLGNAMLAAKLEFLKPNAAPDHQLRRVALLGDPNLKPPTSPVTSVIDGPLPDADPYALASFPNPFNEKTTVRFTTKKRSYVSVAVYNALGAKVATILDQNLPSGTHSMNWNSSGVPEGAYLCRVHIDDTIETLPLIVVR